MLEVVILSFCCPLTPPIPSLQVVYLRFPFVLKRGKKWLLLVLEIKCYNAWKLNAWRFYCDMDPTIPQLQQERLSLLTNVL